METGALTIEDHYQQRIAEMTPAEKFERMHAMNAWARWNMARRITEREGEIPPAVMKWKIALQLYGKNPVCRELIEQELARVLDS